jgi:hypothetical protein
VRADEKKEEGMAKHDGSTRRTITAFVAGALAVGLIGLYSGGVAIATHEPAQKVAATGSDIEEVNDNTVILSETARVASTEDLVLQLTAECSILTELTTGNESGSTEDEASATGTVRLRIEIDGTPVFVATNDATGGDDDAEDDDDEAGEVTFCNRTYERMVSDNEDPSDGLDTEHDFIRTRAANAFNWLATDIGVNYDDPANGNNIVLIEVIADFDTTTAGDAVADAFVGSRTLIAEPTNASTHETVDPAGQ